MNQQKNTVTYLSEASQVEQYQPLITKLVHQLFVKYGGRSRTQLLFGCLSLDDLEQCARLACVKAIRKYCDNKNTKLLTYLHVVIFREVRRTIQHFGKQCLQTVPLNYNSLLTYDNDDFWEVVPDNISDKECLVLEMRLAGYTLKEIGAELSVTCERARIILEEIYEKIRIASA